VSGVGELIKDLAPYGPWGIVAVVLLLFFFFPDKVQRWAELIWALLAKVWGGFGRRSVKLSLQGRLNRFMRQLSDETGRAERTRIDVEWAPADETPSHFLKDERIVVRLHNPDLQDRNLVTSTMIVVSETVIRRAKAFLSPKQARSIDLHAVDHLLATTPHAQNLFREEVSGPECDMDRSLADLVAKHQKIDRVHLFFPVLVRELHYLEQRVVVKPRDERLIVDVSNLIDFLVTFADRVQGEDIRFGVQGRELRCAIMIVAKHQKRELGLAGGYVNRLKDLRRAGCDTVYLVGPAVKDNALFMSEIVTAFTKDSRWEEVGRREYTAPLRTNHSETVRKQTLLIVLRNPNVPDVLDAEAGAAADVAFPETITVDAVE
jgi:hypothetical protein